MAHDVVVVGAGVVGAAAALRARDVGLDVLLLDGAHPGRASDAGAGIVSPATNTRDGEAWFALASAAAGAYPALVERLADAGVGDTGYRRVGELVVAMSAEEAERLEATAPGLIARSPSLELVGADAAVARYPVLGRPRAALWAPDAAQVDGRLLAAGLVTAAHRAGVVVERATVGGLCRQGRRVVGVVADGEEVHAGTVLIAGGAWSASLAAELGLPARVEPQRGQIVHLQTGRTDTAGWPIVAAVGDHYQVPWPDGRVAVGATRETGSGFEAKVTAAGVAEVLAEALRVAPGLGGAELAEVRVGLRPLTADLLPLLGPLPAWEGVFIATGHGPTGLTLGPFTGGLVAELVAGQAPAFDLGPYAFDRPALQQQQPVPAPG
jgi:D-amino-acid dehydrogenase